MPPPARNTHQTHRQATEGGLPPSSSKLEMKRISVHDADVDRNSQRPLDPEPSADEEVMYRLALELASNGRWMMYLNAADGPAFLEIMASADNWHRFMRQPTEFVLSESQNLKSFPVDEETSVHIYESDDDSAFPLDYPVLLAFRIREMLADYRLTRVDFVNTALQTYHQPSHHDPYLDAKSQKINPISTSSSTPTAFLSNIYALSRENGDRSHTLPSRTNSSSNTKMDLMKHVEAGIVYDISLKTVQTLIDTVSSRGVQSIYTASSDENATGGQTPVSGSTATVVPRVNFIESSPNVNSRGGKPRTVSSGQSNQPGSNKRSPLRNSKQKDDPKSYINEYYTDIQDFYIDSTAENRSSSLGRKSKAAGGTDISKSAEEQLYSDDILVKEIAKYRRKQLGIPEDIIVQDKPEEQIFFGQNLSLTQEKGDSSLSSNLDTISKSKEADHDDDYDEEDEEADESKNDDDILSKKRKNNDEDGEQNLIDKKPMDKKPKLSSSLEVDEDYDDDEKNECEHSGDESASNRKGGSTSAKKNDHSAQNIDSAVEESEKIDKLRLNCLLSSTMVPIDNAYYTIDDYKTLYDVSSNKKLKNTLWRNGTGLLYIPGHEKDYDITQVELEKRGISLIPTAPVLNRPGANSANPNGDSSTVRLDANGKPILTKEEMALKKARELEKAKKASLMAEVHPSFHHLYMSLYDNIEKDGKVDEFRKLLSDVRPNKSKWFDEYRIGQDTLYDHLEKMLEALKTVPTHSKPFLRPVTLKEAPTYFDVIKNPMDLSTMEKKLKNREYLSKQQFADDAYLIWSNCMTFSQGGGPNDPYRKAAATMKRKTTERLKRVPDITIRVLPRPKDIKEEKASSSDSSATAAGGESTTNGENSQDTKTTNASSGGVTSGTLDSEATAVAPSTAESGTTNENTTNEARVNLGTKTHTGGSTDGTTSTPTKPPGLPMAPLSATQDATSSTTIDDGASVITSVTDDVHSLANANTTAYDSEDGDDHTAIDTNASAIGDDDMAVDESASSTVVQESLSQPLSSQNQSTETEQTDSHAQANSLYIMESDLASTKWRNVVGSEADIPILRSLLSNFKDKKNSPSKQKVSFSADVKSQKSKDKSGIENRVSDSSDGTHKISDFDSKIAVIRNYAAMKKYLEESKKYREKQLCMFMEWEKLLEERLKEDVNSNEDNSEKDKENKDDSTANLESPSKKVKLEVEDKPPSEQVKSSTNDNKADDNKEANNEENNVNDENIPPVEDDKGLKSPEKSDVKSKSDKATTKSKDTKEEAPKPSMDELTKLMTVNFLPEIEYFADCVPAIKAPLLNYDPFESSRNDVGKLSKKARKALKSKKRKLSKPLPSLSDYPEIMNGPSRGIIYQKITETVFELKLIKQIHAKIISTEQSANAGEDLGDQNTIGPAASSSNISAKQSTGATQSEDITTANKDSQVADDKPGTQENDEEGDQQDTTNDFTAQTAMFGIYQPVTPLSELPPLVLDNKSAHACLKQSVASILSSVGFEQSLDSTLSIFLDVITEQFLKIGKTLRTFIDHKSKSWSMEKMLLHTLYDTGSDQYLLEEFIKNDIMKQATKTHELRLKLVYAYRDMMNLLNPDDEVEAIEHEDAVDRIMSGNFMEELGVDFLNLRDFGLSIVNIPPQLWNKKADNPIRAKLRYRIVKKREIQDDVDDAASRKFKEFDHVVPEEQIGLLKPFFERKIKEQHDERVLAKQKMEKELALKTVPDSSEMNDELESSLEDEKLKISQFNVDVALIEDKDKSPTEYKLKSQILIGVAKTGRRSMEKSSKESNKKKKKKTKKK